MVRNEVDRGMQSVSIVAAQQIIQRTLPTLERKVDDAIVGKPEAIDLILSGVQIVDSAGLNWLIAVNGRLESLGIPLRLRDPSPVMADVLLATRLDSRFIVEVTDAANAGGGTGPGGVNGR
ncbi:MAG TPA: STAS domain-containing protein [Phycisphaerae bacterium]